MAEMDGRAGIFRRKAGPRMRYTLEARPDLRHWTCGAVFANRTLSAPAHCQQVVPIPVPVLLRVPAWSMLRLRHWPSLAWAPWAVAVSV